MEESLESLLVCIEELQGWIPGFNAIVRMEGSGEYLFYETNRDRRLVTVALGISVTVFFPSIMKTAVLVVRASDAGTVLVKVVKTTYSNSFFMCVVSGWDTFYTLVLFGD